MKSFLKHFKAGTSHSLLGVVLVLLLTLELFTGAFWGLQGSFFASEPEVVLQLSEIAAPTIDEVAAMITTEEEACLSEQALLPGGAWLILLLFMGALLIWNFALALLTKQKLEWIPEVAYVVLILLIWNFFDPCHAAAWFPVALIKTSLLIFALYLYLFEKQKAS